jgi:hypothetical protein
MIVSCDNLETTVAGGTLTVNAAISKQSCAPSEYSYAGGLSKKSKGISRQPQITLKNFRLKNLPSEQRRLRKLRKKPQSKVFSVVDES